MSCREIYMRHTTKEGAAYVVEHRVWDANLFVTSQRDAAKKEGGNAEQITRDQYLNERKVQR